MKKRVFAWLVVVALVVGMLPTMVLAADGAVVGMLDLQSVESVETDNYTWDADSGILTILEDGLTIESPADGIILPMDKACTIILNGDLTIETEETGIAINKLGVDGTKFPLTISGDGKLTMDTGAEGILQINGDLTLQGVNAEIYTAVGSAIMGLGDIVMDGCAIHATAKKYGHAVYNIDGDVKIADCTLVAEGYYQGIASNGELEITGNSHVTSEGIKGHGIYACNDAIITDATVETKGRDEGILVQKDVVVKGNAQVTSTAGTYDIAALGNIILEDTAKVTGAILGQLQETLPWAPRLHSMA